MFTLYSQFGRCCIQEGSNALQIKGTKKLGFNCVVGGTVFKLPQLTSSAREANLKYIRFLQVCCCLHGRNDPGVLSRWPQAIGIPYATTACGSMNSSKSDLMQDILEYLHCWHWDGFLAVCSVSLRAELSPRSQSWACFGKEASHKWPSPLLKKGPHPIPDSTMTLIQQKHWLIKL